MVEKTLFVESLENHQKLVDILLAHENEKGICEISEEELQKSINRSMAWVKKAIKKINTEDMCIEIVGVDRYLVHYDSLLKKGVFSVILRMILHTAVDFDMLSWKNEKLMQEFGCTLKTVQMYRAFCTVGWKQGIKDEN